MALMPKDSKILRISKFYNQQKSHVNPILDGKIQLYASHVKQTSIPSGATLNFHSDSGR